MPERTVSHDDPPVSATLAWDRDRIALSDSLALSVRVSGPAPLRVEPAPGLLTEAGSASWHVRERGPATVADLPDGRQLWRRDYRLDPFGTGEVSLDVAPLSVAAGGSAEGFPLAWEPVMVRVATSVTAVGTDQLRPITGIERTPEPPPDTSAAWWAVPVAAAVLVLAVLLWRRLARRPPARVDPAERAAARFAALGGLDGRAALIGLAETWREFARSHWGEPAGRMTSDELVAGLLRDGRLSADHAADLETVLRAGDRAKFAPAGVAISPAEPLVERSVRLLAALREEGENATSGELG